MHDTSRMILAAFAVLGLALGVRAQDEKLVRELTPEATASILKELKIDFNKGASKKGDEHYFEFVRNGYRIRLTQFSPTEFMLDCVFRGFPIMKVNEWNQLTRFSRASLHKDPSGDVTLLAYGLDAAAGVNAATIKQYLSRFDDELKKYDRFVPDDTILAKVTDDKIENIFKSQGIAVKKIVNSKGLPIFNFEINNQKLRLYHFGKDLMLEAQFQKLELEHVNRYNLNRKFIRVVNYRDQGKKLEYTALESNFDCEAGVTEGMIRHWIALFGDESQEFAAYVRKLTALAEKK